MSKAPSIFLALAAVFLASGARAASETPPPAPKVDLAKLAAEKLADLIKRGNEQCTAGDVDQGLPALRAAWTQRQDADLAVALASCEIKASEWPSAADHLAWALRNKDDPETRKSLEATFTNVRARVGAVKVTVTVDGADVFAGDRFAGQSPLPGEVFVAAGKSRIFAKKTGYGEIEGTVDVKPGGTAILKIDLAGEGTVAQSQRVTGSRSAAPAYVMGAVALVALGAGTAFYAAALSKGDAADDLLGTLQTDYPKQGTSPCAPTTHAACSTLQSLRSSHDTFAGAGTGFLAGGGALGAAAIIYGLWAAFSPPPVERPSTLGRATPADAAFGGRAPIVGVSVSPGAGGVWLRGAF
jgi:hypothetical protein